MSHSRKLMLTTLLAWCFAAGTQASPAPRKSARTTMPSVLNGRPRDSGQFQPAQNKCARNDKGEVVLEISGRTPGEWGGCCLEQPGDVVLRSGARPRVEVTLEHDDSVDVKFEAGPFGRPTATGWVHRGPMKAGSAAFAELLEDDFRNLLSSEIRARRMCVALVGPKGPPHNKLTIRAVTLEQ